MKSYLESALIRIKVHFLFVCVFLIEIVKGMREVTQTTQFVLNGLTVTSGLAAPYMRAIQDLIAGSDRADF